MTPTPAVLPAVAANSLNEGRSGGRDSYCEVEEHSLGTNILVEGIAEVDLLDIDVFLYI